MTTFKDLPPQSRRASRASVRTEGFEVDATVRPPTARTGRRAQLPSATEWQKDEAELAAERAAAADEQQVVTYGGPGPDAADVVIEPATEADLVVPAPVPGRRVSLPTGEHHPYTHALTLPATEGTVADDAVPAIDATDTSATDISATDASVSDASGSTVSASTDAASDDTVSADVASSDALSSGALTSEAPSTEQPAAVQASADEAPARPLTRREIREARVAAERAAGLEEVPEAIVSILNSGPIILPYLSSPATTATPIVSDRVEHALAEFDELTSVHEGDETPVGDDDHIAAPASTWDIPLEPAPSHVEDEDNEGVDDPVDGGRTPLGISVPSFVDSGQTPVSNRAAGHWSITEDDDDDITSIENTITRSVGTGGILTTNALVLPSIPQPDLTTPYTATGDTILTGSIDLPRSLGHTGVHPSQVDNSDFEHDPLDREVPSTDSAPVRAIRAVSTHTGSNGLIAPKKPQGNHMLTVLVVSSSGLAVVVVGLLVAGISSGLFQ